MDMCGLWTGGDPKSSKQTELTASMLAAVAGVGQPPYLHSRDTLEEVKAATHWLVVDVSNEVSCRVSTINRPY